jgi:phosphatidylglycerophosphate synthase
LALAIAPIGVTPNMVTTFGLMLGLLAAVLFALGEATAGWGSLLLALSFVIDHADGELARSTGQSSRFGYYFDMCSGALILASVFFGIGIGFSSGPLGPWAIMMGATAGLAIAVIFAVRLDLERVAGPEATKQPNVLGFETEDVLYLIVPIAWLGGLQTFLVAASIGAPAYLIWQLGASRRLRTQLLES